jgi:PilZ domain-containing protein
MRECSVTTLDRRQTPRTKLVEIAYIGMGPENGGLVLDVSDGGLALHAVSPVQPHETIQFLLSLQGHSRIEGAGEVVWTNEMRTICGLRFTSLSVGARELLNSWTNQSQMPVAARENVLSPAAQTESTAYDASPLGANPDPIFAIPPAPEVYLTAPMTRTLWQEPLFFWIIYGLIGAALAATGFFYGVHVGKSEISSVARPAANLDSPASPPVLASVPVPAPSDTSDASSVPSGAPVDAPKLDDTSASTVPPPTAEGNSTAPPNPHAGQVFEAGQSELTAALAYLQGSNNKLDRPKAARLLWAAVGNGNSTAEVILADLYLRGDGVSRSCEQGRVLLRAASKSGNILADEKLQELKAKGCR